MGSRVATTATISACIRNEDHVDFADDGRAITSFAFAWTLTTILTSLRAFNCVVETVLVKGILLIVEFGYSVIK